MLNALQGRLKQGVVIGVEVPACKAGASCVSPPCRISSLFRSSVQSRWIISRTC